MKDDKIIEDLKQALGDKWASRVITLTTERDMLLKACHIGLHYTLAVKKIAPSETVSKDVETIRLALGKAEVKP